MQITLQESEIKEALIHYIGDQGINLSDMDIDVSFTAGRKENGNTATIDLVKKDHTGDKPKVATKVQEEAEPNAIEEDEPEPPEAEAAPEIPDGTSLFSKPT